MPGDRDARETRESWRMCVKCTLGVHSERTIEKLAESRRRLYLSSNRLSIQYAKLLIVTAWELVGLFNLVPNILRFNQSRIKAVRILDYIHLLTK
jgi:hypothetical protein